MCGEKDSLAELILASNLQGGIDPGFRRLSSLATTAQTVI